MDRINAVAKVALQWRKKLNELAKAKLDSNLFFTSQAVIRNNTHQLEGTKEKDDFDFSLQMEDFIQDCVQNAGLASQKKSNFRDSD